GRQADLRRSSPANPLAEPTCGRAPGSTVRPVDPGASSSIHEGRGVRRGPIYGRSPQRSPPHVVAAPEIADGVGPDRGRPLERRRPRRDLGALVDRPPAGWYRSQPFSGARGRTSTAVRPSPVALPRIEP